MVLKHLGNFNLKALTHSDIRAFITARRADDINDATIKRNISLISAVVKWSIDRQLDGCPETNVIKTYDRSALRERKPVDRHLRAAQFQKVLDCCKDDTDRRIVIVLAGSGLRTSELLNLKWSEVNLKDLVIEFGHLDTNRTKTGRSRKVPILPGVDVALQAQKQAQPPVNGDSYVFPARRSGKFTKKGGRRQKLGYLRVYLQKATGLGKGFTIHGLRHSFASWLLQRGVDSLRVRDLLGHSTLYTTTRYAGYLSDDDAAEVRLIGIPVVAQSATQRPGLKEEV